MSLRPSDIYDPLLWCPRNMWRWALTVFCFLLVCSAPPNWSLPLAGINTKPSAFGLFALAAAGFVAWFAFPYVKVRWLFARCAILGQPRRISLRAPGIRFESADVCADCKWSAFSWIMETPKAFILMQTAAAASYIPKRCLSGSADIARVRTLIRENFRGKFTLRPD